MIGERLKKLRKERKLTQEEAAEKLEMIRSTYSNYESSKREPDFETAQRLADFFGVSVDYLMGRTDIRKQITNDQAKNAAFELYTRLPQHKKKIIDDLMRTLLEDNS